MVAIEAGIMAREGSAEVDPDIHSGATEKEGAWNGGKVKGRNLYGNIFKKKEIPLSIPGSEYKSTQFKIGNLVQIPGRLNGFQSQRGSSNRK